MVADRRRTVAAGFKHQLIKPVEPEMPRTMLESIALAAGIA